MTFEEVEKLQNDVINNKFDYQKLIEALEALGYKRQDIKKVLDDFKSFVETNGF